MFELTVSQRVETNVVARLVRENEESTSSAGRPVVSSGLVRCDSVLEGNGPTGVYNEQGERAQHVQRAALEACDDKGDDTASHQGPGSITDVEFLLGERIFDADHLHEVAEEISSQQFSKSRGTLMCHGALRDKRVARPLREQT